MGRHHIISQTPAEHRDHERKQVSEDPWEQLQRHNIIISKIFRGAYFWKKGCHFGKLPQPLLSYWLETAWGWSASVSQTQSQAWLTINPKNFTLPYCHINYAIPCRIWKNSSPHQRACHSQDLVEFLSVGLGNLLTQPSAAEKLVTGLLHACRVSCCIFLHCLSFRFDSLWLPAAQQHHWYVKYFSTSKVYLFFFFFLQGWFYTLPLWKKMRKKMCNNLFTQNMWHDAGLSLWVTS